VVKLTGERAPGTNRIGGLVIPRHGLDAVARRIIPTSPEV